MDSENGRDRTGFNRSLTSEQRRSSLNLGGAGAGSLSLGREKKMPSASGSLGARRASMNDSALPSVSQSAPFSRSLSGPAGAVGAVGEPALKRGYLKKRNPGHLLQSDQARSDPRLNPNPNPNPNPDPTPNPDPNPNHSPNPNPDLRYFVLSNGILSYYEKKMKEDTLPYGENLKGQVDLASATILARDEEDFIYIVQHVSRGKEIQLTPESQLERQSWIAAIEEHIEWATASTAPRRH